MLPNIPIQDLDLEGLLDIDTSLLEPKQLLAVAKRLQELRMAAPTRRAEAKKKSKALSAPPPSKAFQALMDL